jgi:hypothetical protein
MAGALRKTRLSGVSEGLKGQGAFGELTTNNRGRTVV